MELKVIAKIHTPFTTRFGIPRQSGMVSFSGEIVFEPEYRDINAVRGLEGYSHIWVIWEFSKSQKSEWSPTVRPPRLGGNKRMGVFATRSPFRPNHIGLSCLKLEEICITQDKGAVLKVLGADILDGTPIYDIKPYIAFTDSHPDAVCGFSEDYKEYQLNVNIDNKQLEKLPENLKLPVVEALKWDPRPAYQHDDNREYGMTISCYEIRFKVEERQLTVTDIFKR